MGVVGSPIYRSTKASSGCDASQSSCLVLEDSKSHQLSEMNSEFLRSWVHVIAAKEPPPSSPLSNKSAHTRCDTLAHGSFHSKLKRHTTGASTGITPPASVNGAEGYRSFLARLFWGFGSRIASSPTAPIAIPPLQPSSAASSSTQPSSTSNNLHARSLLSGQVAVDSTIQIGTTTAVRVPSGNSSNNNNAPQMKKMLLKTATNRFSKKKIANLTSLGVFDFPAITNRTAANHRSNLRKRRQAGLKNKRVAPTVKNLGIFNFDLRSETTGPTTFRNYNSNKVKQQQPKPKGGCNVVRVKTVQSNYTVELAYWKEVVAKQSSLLGDHHTCTRQARICLGNTYLKWGDCSQAVQIYESILSKLNANQSLLAASMMEKIGSALGYSTNSNDRQTLSLKYVKEALSIRYQTFGPFHVNTIETMNVLASLYFRLEALEDARDSFYEVLVLRQAVFGHHHPSVAVAAQNLGQVYAKLSEAGKARGYYCTALDIYRKMRIPSSNPSFISVAKDLESIPLNP